jgi:uncharacterized protein YecT (DUF1311 family)
MSLIHALLVLALSSNPWLADAECTDRPECWPEGSAMHTGLVARQELATADKELNTVYSRIIAGLPADEADNYPKKALVAAQREWIKFRDANCASVGEVSGGVRMWKSAATVQCETAMTQARVKELVQTFEGSADDAGK